MAIYHFEIHENKGGPIPPKQFAASRIPGGAVVLMVFGEQVYSAIVETDYNEELAQKMALVLGTDIMQILKGLASEEVRRIMAKESPKEE